MSINLGSWGHQRTLLPIDVPGSPCSSPRATGWCLLTRFKILIEVIIAGEKRGPVGGDLDWSGFISRVGGTGG